MLHKWKNGSLNPGHSCRGKHTCRQRESSVCSVFLLCAHTAVTLISLFPPHSVNVFMTNKLKSAVFCSRPTIQHNTPQKHDNHQAGTKEPGVFFYNNYSSKASTASRSQPIRIRRNSESYKAAL